MTIFSGPRGRLPRLAAGLSLLVLAACPGGGGGGGGTGSDPVTQVSVTGEGNLQVGGTVQLTATPRTSSGAAVGGKTAAWSSTAEGVATVSQSGAVTGVASGTATIRATVDGVTGQMNVTVAPVPVASVTLDTDAFLLAAGATRQLQATPRDGAGGALTGRTVAWTTLNAAVATVSGAGLVQGQSAGEAKIVATVEGKADTATVTVVVPASLQVTPAYATPATGAAVALQATGRTAGGVVIEGLPVTWTALTNGLNLTAAGSASAGQPGVYRAQAAAGALRDTATLAVLASTSVLSTAFAKGNFRADVKAGELVTVPVVIDLSRVSATGDLGSLQLEIGFDPAVLTYDSRVAVAQGSLDVFSPSAGKVRVAFIHTAAQGTGVVTVANLRFRVAAGAAVGTRRALTLTYTAAPTATNFGAYPMPVAVGGTIRVVP